MTSLRATLSSLANEFAAGVLDAIRGASLEEILSESAGGGGRRGARGRRDLDAATALPSTAGRTGGRGRGRSLGRGGRLSRRSAEDIQAMVERICGLLG